MKKILVIILSAFGMSLFQSCEKSSGSEGFDFSNSLTPYVALSSTKEQTVKQNSSVIVNFQMRTALQQPVTVHYKVTGALNLPNETVIIDRNNTSVAKTIVIPANVIVSPNTSATATLTLIKAVKADGTLLTIGQKNTPATETFTINITL